jgi:hypothetical protein
VFRSIVDLQTAIKRSIAEHNGEPKPFVWTADPERVLAADHGEVTDAPGTDVTSGKRP